jgi:hypothetical protein
MNKAYLFIGCMSKIKEYGVWLGEVDSENLSIFYLLFLIQIYLVYYFA